MLFILLSSSIEYISSFCDIVYVDVESRVSFETAFDESVTSEYKSLKAKVSPSGMGNAKNSKCSNSLPSGLL